MKKIAQTPSPKRQWVSKPEILRLLRANQPDPDFFRDVAELGALEDLTDPWQRKAAPSSAFGLIRQLSHCVLQSRHG